MQHRIIRGEGLRKNRRTLPRPDVTGELSLGIIFENREWLTPLFEALSRAGVPFEAIDVQDAAFDLRGSVRHPLYLNRVSPSSYIRGNGPAIRYAHALLTSLEGAGIRVANGALSFQMETSKVRQQLLMDGLGVPTPRTIVFNNCQQVLELAKEFPFPAILKPDTGGSGALIKKIASYSALEALLAEENLFEIEELFLLQEFIESRDRSVIRTEFVDGELIFAMRVLPENTFNLCPADGCKRTPGDADKDGGRAAVRFELFEEIPEEAVAQAREIVREARLDVGGVEYIETADGRRVFYDINATSVYREDICRAAEVDAFGKLCGFLARELAKEAIKRSAGRAEGNGG